MARHEMPVEDDTAEAIEAAIGKLRAVGMPAGTTVRVRVRASFNKDGGYARTVTARWTSGDNSTSPRRSDTPR